VETNQRTTTARIAGRRHYRFSPLSKQPVGAGADELVSHRRYDILPAQAPDFLRVFSGLHSTKSVWRQRRGKWWLAGVITCRKWVLPRQED
jgi:hypothetical protein